MSRPQETSTVKSNEIEANSQQTQLHRILTAPTTVSETPSAKNQTSQLHRHTQSQFQSVCENSYLNPQPRETDVGRSADGTHNNERSRSQRLMTTPSTSQHVPNLIRVSSQLFESTSRKPSSSVIKNAVAKKTRLENITRYMSAAQHLSNPSVRSSCSLCTQSPHNHLQVSREPVNHDRCHSGGNGTDQRLQGTINNTPAAQNLLNLAYQSRFLVEKSHQRQHLPTEEDYLQQIARIQGLLRRPDILPTTDQRGYIQHSMMNGGLVTPNQANSINHHSQFLQRPENQFVPIDKDHMQQVLRPQLLWGSTEGTHTVHNVNSQNVGMNIPFTTQNSSYVPSQSHHNVELQRQNPPNDQDPQRDLPTSKIQFDPSFNSRSNSQRHEPHITSSSVLLNFSNPKKQSNVHENSLVRDPRIQIRLNQSSTEHHSNLTTVPQNITMEPVTMQDFEVQTTSSGPSHETQFILNPDIHVYQEPRTKKPMVDQSTATNFNIDQDHCNETVRSPVIKMSPRIIDSGCQTDINLLEKPLIPCQEVASDHEIVSDKEEISDQAEVSDNEMSTDVPPLDMNNTVICTEESPPQNNTEEIPTVVQNFTTENQQVPICMRNAGKFKFAVVKFLQQPYPNIDEYICIPQSWIKERRVTDRESLVAYPSENPTITIKRVKKAKKDLDKWKFYMAIVKHETNSYEDAYNYIAARKYDAAIENRCVPTAGAGQILLPSTTTGVNSSSLKRNKQSINHQKRFKVVDDINLTNRCRYSRKSSESSNNKLISMTSGPSTHVSSEKLIEVMDGKSSSTQNGSYQNNANSSSVCSSSSANTSQCLPVNYKCIQQDLRATGRLARSSPKVTVVNKSPSVKNNTVQHTLHSSNQPVQSFNHLQQNQLLQSHQDRLLQYSHPEGMHGKPQETQVINPGTFSQNIAGNTYHAPLTPLISANQSFQKSQQPKENQISSTYYDHLQRITINNEIHRRNILNLQSLLPDFSTNQCSQGFRQSTPYTAQNVVNQFSQISNSSSVYQDQAQVLLIQDIPDRQSSEVNCTNYVPSSDSGTMDVHDSNLVHQSTVPIQRLDVNQPPVDGDHSQQDPSLQEKINDESTEETCIERSVSSEQCTKKESSTIPSSENQSVESMMERLHSDDKVTTDDVSSTQDLDDVNEQSYSEMNTKEELTSQSPCDQEGQAVDSIANIEDLWLDRMADLFDKMNSDFSHTCKMAHELHESLVQSAKTFQCIASLSANLRKLKKSKATVETPKKVTVEVQKVAEKEQVVMGVKEKSDVDMAENKKKDNNEPKKSDDNDESSNNDKSTVNDNDHDNDNDKNKDKNKNKRGDGDKDKDKNRDGGDKDEDKDNDEDADVEEAPKKIRGCTRTFALPPEYNPKDTKWTLKYRKPDAKLGLVELVEKSRVYINSIKLAHCKRVSKDSKTLARMLLMEIFSLNALAVCSLTGARANAFDINGTNVRPGLDEHARMVILSFVEEHAREKGWGPFDTQGVINSIRSKIQEVRAKYGQT